MPQPLSILWKDGENAIAVETPRCIVCDHGGVMTIRKQAYEDWQNGTFIQDAFPELSPGQREQLMTGIHPTCFTTFGEEDL